MNKMVFVLIIVAFITMPAAMASAQPMVPTLDKALLKLVVENSGGFPVDGTIVSVTDEDGKKILSSVTDKDGVLAILVPIGKSYLVKFISFGTEKKETAKKIAVPDKANFKFTVKMVYNPVFVSTFTLDGVHFDTAKATLKPESYAALSDLLDYMTAKESAEIELSGHTDSNGDDQKNLELSQARAEAVRDYLVKEGIKTKRITPVGYGETKPIAPNETAFGRQQNRRTEVKILKE